MTSNSRLYVEYVLKDGTVLDVDPDSDYDCDIVIESSDGEEAVLATQAATAVDQANSPGATLGLDVDSDGELNLIDETGMDPLFQGAHALLRQRFQEMRNDIRGALESRRQQRLSDIRRNNPEGPTRMQLLEITNRAMDCEIKSELEQLSQEEHKDTERLAWAYGIAPMEG
ncbi:hypothetical protein RSOLAG22IIIB_08353 [Rhizoctonia solani]|uniref:Uncharacterized protein n=1 Tax=Rhizoctonia solani TaxID=456999 RepID=A0A0K6FT02_9AGAM|nr:hypothetical protein RSOLAG22IIIB_08353 [Rhizoctonia solani]